MLTNLCKEDKWPLGIVTGFFVLTVGVSTILALTVSQQAAYLWLSFVLIGILFITTFTRSSRMPVVTYDSGYERRPSEHLRAYHRFAQRAGSGPSPPYYVRPDPPPSYNAAITIIPEACEPPPYINLFIHNPSIPAPPYTQPPPVALATIPPIDQLPLTFSTNQAVTAVDQLPMLSQLAVVNNAVVRTSNVQATHMEQTLDEQATTISNTLNAQLTPTNNTSVVQTTQKEPTTVDTNNVAEPHEPNHAENEHGVPVYGDQDSNKANDRTCTKF